MAYHYQKNFKEDQVSFTVYELPDDSKRIVYVFYITKSRFIDEPTYIGTVRYNTSKSFFTVLENYTLETPIVNFKNEIQYFLDNIR